MYRMHPKRSRSALRNQGNLPLSVKIIENQTIMHVDATLKLIRSDAVSRSVPYSDKYLSSKM